LESNTSTVPSWKFVAYRNVPVSVVAIARPLYTAVGELYSSTAVFWVGRRVPAADLARLGVEDEPRGTAARGGRDDELVPRSGCLGHSARDRDGRRRHSRDRDGERADGE
jgi:hypothetical protein